MRKIILPFLALCISGNLSFGKSVDQTTAQTIGCNFLLNQGNELKISDMSLAYQATSLVNGNTVTDFYVFNSANGGFVMVAGDDNITPVLAYDCQSSFDASNLFVNVNGFLNTYKKEINYVIAKNINATATTTAQWTALQQAAKPGAAARTTVTGVVPLIPVQWNQTPYVNALCPFDASSDTLTLTGCVATAMAQVMRYWKWPVNGTGSHSYSSPYGLLSADFVADNYVWDSMPVIINKANTYVAKIMYDAGVSVNMDYGVESSGAFVTEASSPITNCAEYALQTYFGYKTSTIQGVSRDAYTDSAWVNLIKSELDAKRPVLYTGDGSQGGHCFIADGYTTEDRLHFNWGWGGYCNGYYIVESLEPEVGVDFNNDQTLIIGIMPDTVGNSPAVSPSGVQPIVSLRSLSVYPNPASDVINIDLQGTKANLISLTDMTGRILTTINPAVGTQIVTVPVNEYAAGMYLLQIETTTGTLTKKIVVTK